MGLKGTLSRGRQYLCVDCLSTNIRLRRYYEDLGYEFVGELTGPTDHAHTIAHGSWKRACTSSPSYRSERSPPQPAPGRWDNELEQ